MAKAKTIEERARERLEFYAAKPNLDDADLMEVGICRVQLNDYAQARWIAG